MTTKSQRMKGALDRALKKVERHPTDGAAICLAREYARAIDAGDTDGETLNQLGPKFLDTLEHLLMTPKARAKVTKGAPSAPVNNPVDELRARRAARAAAAGKD